jgi:DNA/RNA endonuclease G (NUC1)
MKKQITILLLFSFFITYTSSYAQKAPGKNYRPIVLDPNYNHTKWGITPTDLVYYFAAYTTSFDSDDDNNGDGTPDIWGVPEWVAYEIKRKSDKPMPEYKRPASWLTDDSFNAKGIVPNDDTYAVAGTNEMKVVKDDYRFVRGHMCPKETADRMGEDAGYNTHTMLNAVPQLQWQNNGIWKLLEQKCMVWADKYGQIWVVSGPANFKKNPSMWLGQNGEVKAAIPDAIYKIVIRENKESQTGVKTLAFLFPNIIPKEMKDISDFLTSIEEIEKITGLHFLTNLSKDNQLIEKKKLQDVSENTNKQGVIDQW